MKLLIILALVVLTRALPVDDNIFHYNGYQVIRTFPATSEQYKIMHELEDGGQFDFWSELRPGRPTDVMVDPDQIGVFLQYLTHYEIPFEVFIQDVEKIVSEQRIASAKRVKTGEFNWEDYQSIEDINAFVKKLANDFPKMVAVEIIGKSYQGREIPLIKISTGGTGKRGVFIDGNIHAREWISPAVVTYIINELVTKSSENSDVLSLYDFYIVPNLNPDGYAFSNSYINRMWRKTRSDHASDRGCIGVDGNRNWGYKWGDPGSSPDKCSDLYMGPEEFSEAENEAVQKFILNTPANWLFYLTIHSYGQYCLISYGDGTRPDDFNELMVKGNAYANAVFGHSGTIYTVGNIQDQLYTTSGTSQDWAKAVAKIKYSYTLELRDLGTWGFLLPPNQIIPTAVETWVGIRAMLLK